MSNIILALNWASFLFFSLGAIGGVVYLIELSSDIRAARRKHVRDRHDPWLDEPTENIVQLHPQQASKEAPISARFK